MAAFILQVESLLVICGVIVTCLFHEVVRGMVLIIGSRDGRWINGCEGGF